MQDTVNPTTDTECYFVTRQRLTPACRTQEALNRHTACSVPCYFYTAHASRERHSVHTRKVKRTVRQSRPRTGACCQSVILVRINSCRLNNSPVQGLGSGKLNLSDLSSKAQSQTSTVCFRVSFSPRAATFGTIVLALTIFSDERNVWLYSYYYTKQYLYFIHF